MVAQGYFCVIGSVNAKFIIVDHARVRSDLRTNADGVLAEEGPAPAHASPRVMSLRCGAVFTYAPPPHVTAAAAGARVPGRPCLSE